MIDQKAKFCCNGRVFDFDAEDAIPPYTERCGHYALTPSVNVKHGRRYLVYRCPRCGKIYQPEQIRRIMLKANGDPSAPKNPEEILKI